MHLTARDCDHISAKLICKENLIMKAANPHLCR